MKLLLDIIWHYLIILTFIVIWSAINQSTNILILSIMIYGPFFCTYPIWFLICKKIFNTILKNWAMYEFILRNIYTLLFAIAYMLFLNNIAIGIPLVTSFVIITIINFYQYLKNQK